MEDFEQLLVRYDFLIRKALRHMRIYEGFEEFYHIATIGLWQAQMTHCVEKGMFEKYAFLKIKYMLADELSRRTKNQHVLYTEKSVMFEQVYTEQEDFRAEWFFELQPEEQQLLRWIFVMGYTSGEIAQQLQLTEETVKKRRQRLLRRLKRLENVLNYKWGTSS